MPDLPPTNPSGKPTDPDGPAPTGPYFAPTPHLASADDIQAGTIIAGKYKLLEAIGEGGMGAVWLAQQFEPVKRPVAIKLIRAGMDSKTILARFEAERQALSMMDHPNIARVLDVGAMPGGRPFFVMELVKGTPITDFCDQRKLTPRQRLELFVPVCLAIQHAHQKGVIHRDIKPSNVLVALHDDKPVPKVIDFGVAKATGTPLTEKTLHTGFEQVVGTPAYMSPEQATFNQLDIDTRSDVYSLGVLLYELLTGTTPIERQRFKQAALLEMLRVVREEEPPRPSTRLSSTETKASIAEKRGTEPTRLTKELRTELDWVVMKSLEKDRSRRYSTAVNFADDVQRYLAGEAVQAHPPSASYRMGKFVRKHRGPVFALAVVLLASVGGAAGTVFGIIKADGERAAYRLRLQAEEALEQAETAREGERQAKAEVDLLNYAHAVDLALREHQTNNCSRANELLESCPEPLRGWEWHYVHRLCHRELTELKGHASHVLSASFSGDARRIVTSSDDGSARVWDAESGRELAQLKGDPSTLVRAWFSAGGRRVVTAEDYKIRVWDPDSGKQLMLLKHADSFLSLSGDGRRAATAGTDKTVRVWDCESGRQSVRLKEQEHVVLAASFSGDGRRLVTVVAGIALGDCAVRVWDAESGLELAMLKGRTGSVMSTAVSRDGHRILTVSTDGAARVWDAESGKELSRLTGFTSNVFPPAFSEDGHRILTAPGELTPSGGAKVRVCDADSGKELAVLTGHASLVLSASFSGDGRRVVTASADKTARVWNAETGEEYAVLVGHTSQVWSASFSKDGRRIVTASADKTARVWNAETSRTPLLLVGHTSFIWRTSFSEDAERIVTASDDGTARVWDAETGKQLSRLEGHTKPVRSTSFSTDGSRIVTASDDGTARVWNSRTGEQLAVLIVPRSEVRVASFSRDGRRIVTGEFIDSGRTADGNTIYTARVWDAETGTELMVFKGLSSLVEVALFSRDGRRVVTGSSGGDAQVWDVASGREIAVLKGHTSSVASASLSRDGRRMVTASDDCTARVWDAETGKELALLKGHVGQVDSASFSGDGRRVVTASTDETIRVWDAATGKQLLSLPGHARSRSQASFAEDDRVIRTFGYYDEEMRSLRIVTYDTRPTRETFHKFLEAPPPRPVR